VTKNYLIAFFLAFGILLALLMLPFIIELGATGDALTSGSWVADGMRWVSTGDHFERMLMGLVDTSDLVYFGVVIASFLVLAKTAIESVRWR
jgi:ABC-2 type transport system permease protein